MLSLAASRSARASHYLFAGASLASRQEQAVGSQVSLRTHFSGPARGSIYLSVYILYTYIQTKLSRTLKRK